MNSNNPKTWNEKSIILIICYVIAVLFYTVSPLMVLTSYFCIVVIHDTFLHFQIPIILFLVLLALATPVSFLINRNLQGPLAATGVYSMMSVLLINFLFVLGMWTKKIEKISDFWFKLQLFVPICPAIICVVLVKFMRKERMELEQNEPSAQGYQNVDQITPN